MTYPYMCPYMLFLGTSLDTFRDVCVPVSTRDMLNHVCKHTCAAQRSVDANIVRRDASAESSSPLEAGDGAVL